MTELQPVPRPAADPLAMPVFAGLLQAIAILAIPAAAVLALFRSWPAVGALAAVALCAGTAAQALHYLSQIRHYFSRLEK